eukprot:TRINITY_DN57374_c0_g1_i1.p1 TRINITY_DN57374_c0_g1~~TRINITY_DN57374_c0_g1_i1.p1  ORF type:complete len:548 (-),score=65.46 TRINITY_DN57374_c0_g1_i1:257-1900(-)
MFDFARIANLDHAKYSHLVTPGFEETADDYEGVGRSDSSTACESGESLGETPTCNSRRNRWCSNCVVFHNWAKTVGASVASLLLGAIVLVIWCHMLVTDQSRAGLLANPLHSTEKLADMQLFGDQIPRDELALLSNKTWVTGGAPSSYGPLEDADASHAAKFMSEGFKPSFWVSINSIDGHRVAYDLGSEIPGGAEVARGDVHGCQAKCDATVECGSILFCDGGACHLKTRKLGIREPSQLSKACSSYSTTPWTYRPYNEELLLPSTAPLFSFYIYRAQGADSPNAKYPLANVNVASIGGVMWYLHNEVVALHNWNGHEGRRKFDITRIRRFKITTKATRPLHKKGLNFGLKCSFDSGECTGPHRDGKNGVGTGWHSKPEWDMFGFNVGCDYLGEYPHVERTFKTGKLYPDAIWYSLPGPCPMMNFRFADTRCRLDFPGGLCDNPDGRGNCTYSAEDAGEIDIDELVGITPKWKDRADFVRSGGFEGSPNGGDRRLDFWGHITDATRNARRTSMALDAFHRKYPSMPRHDQMLPPKCDFNKRQYVYG